VRASAAPRTGEVGSRFAYRGAIVVQQGTPVRFVHPGNGGDLSWGEVHTGRELAGELGPGQAEPHRVYDSVWVETTVQSFRTGLVELPGLEVEVGRAPRVSRGRLPVVRVVVTSVLSAADSLAELQPVRGPYAAPWWERVPWTLVLAAAGVLAALVWGVRRLMRRKPAPAPAAAPVAPARPRASPHDEALAALRALRARQLPEAGRFDEHAFELTRLTRRFLEATLVTPRPGDTSAELIERLRSGALGPERLERLAALLSLWDRVKFARAPLTVVEARRAEDAVEGLVTRAAEPPREVA
jgi:hypothetical protein